MNISKLVSIAFAPLATCCLIFYFVFSSWGCGSSEETSSTQETKPPQEAAARAAQETKTPPTVDTLSTGVKELPKPVNDSRAPVSAATLSSGKFSVQIGAYKMPDNADRVAALAKERFGMNVYSVRDIVDDLYKVYIGDFTAKEEARKFRDEMVQKYPTDYKDAWVSEIPQK